MARHRSLNVVGVKGDVGAEGQVEAEADIKIGSAHV